LSVLFCSSPLLLSSVLESADRFKPPDEERVRGPRRHVRAHGVVCYRLAQRSSKRRRVEVRAESTWRHREACVQTKRNCEGGVAVRGFYKNLVRFAPVWVGIVVNSVVVFSSFVGTLYCWAWLVGGCS